MYMVLRNESELQLACIYTFIKAALNNLYCYTYDCMLKWSYKVMCEKDFIIIWWAKFTIARFARRLNNNQLQNSDYLNNTIHGPCNQQTHMT